MVDDPSKFCCWQLTTNGFIIVSVEEEEAAYLAATHPESIFFFAELS